MSTIASLKVDLIASTAKFQSEMRSASRTANR